MRSDRRDAERLRVSRRSCESVDGAARGRYGEQSRGTCELRHRASARWGQRRASRRPVAIAPSVLVRDLSPRALRKRTYGDQPAPARRYRRRPARRPSPPRRRRDFRVADCLRQSGRAADLEWRSSAPRVCRAACARRQSPEAYSTTGGGMIAARSALAISQIALSVILLAGALLLIRSFQRLQQIDLGMKPDHALTFAVI